MRDTFSRVKMLDWFPPPPCDYPSFGAPVDISVEKREEINLPFIKRQQFNGLRLWILIHYKSLIAPKKGIDNSPANL